MLGLSQQNLFSTKSLVSADAVRLAFRVFWESWETLRVNRPRISCWVGAWRNGKHAQEDFHCVTLRLTLTLVTSGISLAGMIFPGLGEGKHSLSIKVSYRTTYSQWQWCMGNLVCIVKRTFIARLEYVETERYEKLQLAEDPPWPGFSPVLISPIMSSAVTSGLKSIHLPVVTNSAHVPHAKRRRVRHKISLWETACSQFNTHNALWFRACKN